MNNQNDLLQQALDVVHLEKRQAAQLVEAKKAQEKIDLFWEALKNEMIARGVKSLKGDGFSITLAERVSWKVDMDALPKKFIKKVADTRKIGEVFKLEGEPPKGAEPQYTQYLMKRIK